MKGSCGNRWLQLWAPCQQLRSEWDLEADLTAKTAAIHRHSINKSALLVYPGDKHAWHRTAFPCALCAECGSLRWVPKEPGLAGNRAAGCQVALRLEPCGC